MFNLISSILDYAHPGLDQKVWSPDGKLLPKNKELILNILDGYIKEANLKDFDSWAKKIKIIGGITTYQYTFDSDIDIHIEVDLPKFIKANHPEWTPEEAHEYLNEFRHRINEHTPKLPDTEHPIEYYFETPFVNKEGSPRSGLYNVQTDTWEIEPISVDKDFNIWEMKKSVIDAANEISKELDISVGKMKRNIRQIEDLRDVADAWSGEQKQRYESKIKEKLQSIEEEIKSAIETKTKIVEDRRDYDPMGDAEVKFKYLQRFGYLDLVTELSGLYEDDQQVTEDELDELKDTLLDMGLEERKEASVNKKALTDVAYWVAPDGKAYEVRTSDNKQETHTGWVWYNLLTLKEDYGFNTDNIESIDDVGQLLDEMYDEGWSRIGDSVVPRELEVTVKDMNNIPSAVEAVLESVLTEGSTVAISGQRGSKFVRVRYPWKSLQSAVNDALRQPQMAASKKSSRSVIEVNNGVRVLKNPSWEQAENLLEKSKENFPQKSNKHLRYVIDPRDSTLFLWDAYNEHHTGMMNSLGIPSDDQHIYEAYAGDILEISDLDFVFDKQEESRKLSQEEFINNYSSLNLFNKKASINTEYWIDPKGQIYEAQNGHRDWILDNLSTSILPASYFDVDLDRLEEVAGTDTAIGILDDLRKQMIQQGWVRIGTDEIGDSQFTIEVADINRIPETVDSFVQGTFDYESEKHLEISDLSDRYIVVDNPFPNLQRAVRESLRFQRAASKKDPKSWPGHGKLFIDFDNTIADNSEEDYPDIGKPMAGVKEAFQKLKEQGWEIIIYSCRANEKNGIDEIKKFMEEHRLPYDDIFENKPQAEYYIDDRNVMFTTWSDVLNQVKKDANLRTTKAGYSDMRYWISPDGEIIKLDETHEQWVMDNLVDVFGYSEEDAELLEYGDVKPVMYEDGWIRIGDTEQRDHLFAITVGDLQNIPSSIDNFISEHYQQGGIIEVSDVDGGDYLEISDPFPNIQDAVNKALSANKWTKASNLKRAQMDKGWISPEGEVHLVDNHYDYVIDNLLLFGFSPDYQVDVIGRRKEIFQRGWVRFGYENNQFYLQVDDLEFVPDYINDILPNYVSRNETILVEDMNNNSLTLIYPFKDIRRTIQRELYKAAKKAVKMPKSTDPYPTDSWISPNGDFYTLDGYMHSGWAEKFIGKDYGSSLADGWIRVSIQSTGEEYLYVELRSVNSSQLNVLEELFYDYNQSMFLDLSNRSISFTKTDLDADGTSVRDYIQNYVNRPSKKADFYPSVTPHAPKKRWGPTDVEIPVDPDAARRDENWEGGRYADKPRNRKWWNRIWDWFTDEEPEDLDKKADDFSSDIKHIVDLTRQHGGATWNFSKGNMIGTDNYAVSTHLDRTSTVPADQFNEEVLNEYIMQNKDFLTGNTETSLGTWNDGGTIYMDIVETIPDRERAIELAKQHNQKAIFDLKNLQEIPTGGTGEKLSAYEEDYKKADGDFGAAYFLDPSGKVYEGEDKNHPEWAQEEFGKTWQELVRDGWTRIRIHDNAMFIEVADITNIPEPVENFILDNKVKEYIISHTKDMHTSVLFTETELIDIMESSLQDVVNQYLRVGRAARLKTAYTSTGYWVAPSGESYEVRTGKSFTHADWVWANRKTLIEQGISQEFFGKNKKDFDYYGAAAQMLEKGWARIGDTSYGGLGVEVFNIRKIPEGVENLLPSILSEGDVVTVADLNKNAVEVEYPWKSLQKSVNRNLSGVRTARRGKPKTDWTNKQYDLEPFNPLPTTFQKDIDEKNLNWRYPWKYMRRPHGPNYSNESEILEILRKNPLSMKDDEEEKEASLEEGYWIDQDGEVIQLETGEEHMDWAGDRESTVEGLVRSREWIRLRFYDDKTLVQVADMYNIKNEDALNKFLLANPSQLIIIDDHTGHYAELDYQDFIDNKGSISKTIKRNRTQLAKKANTYDSYWISPDGEVWDASSNHIGWIFDNYDQLVEYGLDISPPQESWMDMDEDQIYEFSQQALQAMFDGGWVRILKSADELNIQIPSLKNPPAFVEDFFVRNLDAENIVVEGWNDGKAVRITEPELGFVKGLRKGQTLRASTYSDKEMEEYYTEQHEMTQDEGGGFTPRDFNHSTTDYPKPEDLERPKVRLDRLDETVPVIPSYEVVWTFSLPKDEYHGDYPEKEYKETNGI